MKLFADTANLSDIKWALDRGIIHGVTTNPSIIAKAAKDEGVPLTRAYFEKRTKEIVELIRSNETQPRHIHLSVEVWSTDPQEIVKQAEDIKKLLEYDSLSIKVQCGDGELVAVRELAKRGISVNYTCCMTALQALMGGYAGADYISLFWGRIRDGGNAQKNAELKLTDSYEKGIKEGLFAPEDFHPTRVVRETRQLFDASRVETKIIVGSARYVKDIKEAGLAGADFITSPIAFLKSGTLHFKTEEVEKQFLEAFEPLINKK